MKKLIALLLILAASPALAQETATPPVAFKPNVYVMVQAGMYGPYDGQYETLYPDNGFAGNLVFGYKANPNFSAQLELGYLESEGSGGFAFNAMPLVGAFRFGVPLVGLIPGPGTIEPFAIAGGGAYFYKSESAGETLDSIAPGGFLGLGVMYETKSFMVGGEIRYLMTDVDDAPNDGLLAYFNLGYKIPLK